MNSRDLLRYRRREFIGATLLVAVSVPWDSQDESDSREFGYGGTPLAATDPANAPPPQRDTGAETNQDDVDADTETGTEPESSSDDQFGGGGGETEFGKGEYGYGDHGYGGVLS